MRIAQAEAGLTWGRHKAKHPEEDEGVEAILCHKEGQFYNGLGECKGEDGHVASCLLTVEHLRA